MFSKRLRFILIILIFRMLYSTASAQEAHLILLKDHCATPEEVELYNLITAFRRANNLPQLPFSKSLSYVARVHLIDLTENRPDFGGCNLHSWSDKGKWRPCCYAQDQKRLACMSEKPKELTKYKAKAWEIIYEGGEAATPVDAFELWESFAPTKDYLINQGKWSNPWKAIGIAVYGDYAAVWFGEGDDPKKIYTACGSDTAFTIPVEKEEIPRIAVDTSNSVKPVYSIINGTLNSLEKADKEVIRLKEMGYSKARIIVSGENFRISIDEFTTEAEAVRHLKQYREIFPRAWILKPDTP